VVYFLFTHLETDPSKLKSHYESYFWKVVFFSANFKWILLSLILISLAIFTFWLNTLNATKSTDWFKRLQLVSSAAFSIGHGGNDAQKVMGIITAALIANGDIASFHEMPTWVPLACYTAIGLGTMSGGWKIIKTMGTRITKVTPFEGVAAETAGAITLFVTEALKIPVSTTHTITGAIIGVGATKRLSAVRWGVTINLLWAWILTIPVSAVLAALVYFIVNIFI
jgi:inorganic phosphate transporter, PiT family